MFPWRRSSDGSKRGEEEEEREAEVEGRRVEGGSDFAEPENENNDEKIMENKDDKSMSARVAFVLYTVWEEKGSHGREEDTGAEFG